MPNIASVSLDPGSHRDREPEPRSPTSLSGHASDTSHGHGRPAGGPGQGSGVPDDHNELEVATYVRLPGNIRAVLVCLS